MTKGQARVGVSVVIGSYNRRNLLRGTIESVRSQGIAIRHEIIVIDGGSTDGSVEWLVAQKDLITIVQHNRGEFDGKPIERKSWGFFMNLGFRAAHEAYILMLSDDCLLLPNAVNSALNQLSTLEAQGRNIGGVAFYFRNWPAERDYYVQKTLGGKLMVNHGILVRSALEAVGWVDEDRYTFYKADSDVSLKMWQAGYDIVECSHALVEHYVDAGEAVRQSNNAVMARDRQAWKQRWLGIYYHPGQPSQVERLFIRFDDPSRTADTFQALGVGVTSPAAPTAASASALPKHA